MFDKLELAQIPETVSYEALFSYNFEKFAANTNVLNEDFGQSLRKYYDTYTKRGIKPFYNLSLAYNTITNEKKFRFLIVKVKESYVFVPYKIIQILKTRQIRFFEWPVSDNNDENAEKIVFERLVSFDFTRFVFSANIDDTLGCGKLIEYDDYYFTLDDKDALYASSKYRSKNYINKLLNDKNFRVEYGRPKSNAFNSLVKEWKNGMNERQSGVSSNWDRHFNRFITNERNDIMFLVVFYKEMPVSLQVFLCDKDNGYADCLFIVHKWNDDEDQALHRFLSCITEIQKYLAWDNLYNRNNIKKVFIAGCRPSEHRLLSHKERISDGKIKYFIL